MTKSGFQQTRGVFNRRDAVKERMVSTGEKWGWAAWKKGMLSRRFMDFFSGKTKNFFLKKFFKKTWGHFREMPKVAGKSFSQSWKERNGIKE